MRVSKRLLWVASFVVIIFLAWLGWPWPRVAGIPAWLKYIGLLDWLAKLAPLDQWFIAFGTVSALVYAIFSETFLLWWRRPKLRVLFAEAEPFVIQIPIVRQNSINPSIQSRILIRNDGETRAEAVAVYARRLYRRGEEDLTGMSWFIPMDLKWAEDENPITAISAGVERTCNVIGIERPAELVIPLLPGPISMGGMFGSTDVGLAAVKK